MTEQLTECQFNVGDKVVLKSIEEHEANATTMTVLDPDAVYEVVDVGGNLIDIQGASGARSGGWSVVRFLPAPEAAPEAASGPTEEQSAEPRTYTQAELDEALSKARAEYHASGETRIAAVRSLLEQARDRHREDIATIGARLQQEAKERGWCSDYDGAIESLNRDLHVELPRREREYTVTVTARVEITVSAVDEDAAREAARRIAETVESQVDSSDGVSTSHWDSSHDYDVDGN